MVKPSTGYMTFVMLMLHVGLAAILLNWQVRLTSDAHKSTEWTQDLQHRWQITQRPPIATQFLPDSLRCDEPNGVVLASYAHDGRRLNTLQRLPRVGRDPERRRNPLPVRSQGDTLWYRYQANPTETPWIEDSQRRYPAPTELKNWWALQKTMAHPGGVLFWGQDLALFWQARPGKAFEALRDSKGYPLHSEHTPWPLPGRGKANWQLLTQEDEQIRLWGCENTRCEVQWRYRLSGPLYALAHRYHRVVLITEKNNTPLAVVLSEKDGTVLAQSTPSSSPVSMRGQLSSEHPTRWQWTSAPETPDWEIPVDEEAMGVHSVGFLAE